MYDKKEQQRLEEDDLVDSEENYEIGYGDEVQDE